ncbi:MAG: PHB depolymerase family esterase [Betaproteobacteria bacterium]|nr:PHB depolymerase family esterase [Betaproteobacteria bacterium]
MPGATYGLHLPGGHAAGASWPLVVMLHGCKQDAPTFAAGTRMNEIADREGFVVLYPEQRRLANAFRCWNWFDTAAQRSGGEAALIAGMIHEVTAAYAIDPRRVYIAGLSADGAMVNVMVNCYGQLFAARAVHSGLMYRAAESASQAMLAMRQGSSASPKATVSKAAAFVPTLVIHGAGDDAVHPTNADQVVEQVVALSGHAGEPSLRTTEYSTSSGKGYAYATIDRRAGDRLLVRKVLVDGLGHAWSGGNGEHAFNDPAGPDASRMLWEFFPDSSATRRRCPMHQRRTLPCVGKAGDQAINFLSVVGRPPCRCVAIGSEAPRAMNWPDPRATCSLPSSTTMRPRLVTSSGHPLYTCPSYGV